MNRCRIGAALLALLLVLSLLTGWAMKEIHEPAAEDLIQARDAALAGDWNQARLAAGNARSRWRRWQGLRACLSDHTPLEEIDGQLALLDVYGQIEETGDFAALAAQTSRMIQNVADAHWLNAQNFF